MRKYITATIQGDSTVLPPTVNPQTNGYASLSKGILVEDIKQTKIEQYNHTLYNTKTNKITGFTPTIQEDVDVVFALSVDPMMAKFPDESPYIYSGNSPISLIDDGGKQKIYYITKIAKDGTKTTLKVVEKYTVRSITTYVAESIGYGGVQFYQSAPIGNTKTYDLAQVIVIDERTGTVSKGAEYTTRERSNSSIVRAFEDNLEEAGNYLAEQYAGGGGIVFTTSEDIGGNEETRKRGKYTDKQEENIDLLMSVLGAASAAAESKAAENLIESFKQALDAIEIMKAVDENRTTETPDVPKPAEKRDSCTYCHETGKDLKTFKQGGNHSGPIVPAKAKEEKKK